MTDRIATAVAELVEALRAELRGEPAASTAPDRLLSVDEAAAMLGLGRSLTYTEIAAGRLHSVKVGRRRLVPASAIADRIVAAGER
jgi:excisionase family DNA binding protein